MKDVIGKGKIWREISFPRFIFR